MNAFQDLNKDFRSLNEKLIEEYEHSVKEFRKEEREKVQANNERDTIHQKIMDNLGIDRKQIDKMEAREVADSDERIEAARKEMMHRGSMRPSEMQMANFYSDLSENGKQKAIRPYGACIMAADGEHVQHIEGERGNPWVFPTDPSQIKIWDAGHLGGWTCWQAYARYPPPVANVWFHFVPNVTSRWDFSAIFAFHGFYTLRSNDSWWNCRKSWVRLTATVKVYQYGWQAPRTYVLLDKSETNSDYIKFYDATEWLDTSALLRAGDDTWILASITVEAMSLGSGTRAELNFNGGNANYILPLIVTGSPV
jgi:hypothetical protein